VVVSYRHGVQLPGREEAERQEGKCKNRRHITRRKKTGRKMNRQRKNSIKERN